MPAEPDDRAELEGLRKRLASLRADWEALSHPGLRINYDFTIDFVEKRIEELRRRLGDTAANDNP